MVIGTGSQSAPGFGSPASLSLVADSGLLGRRLLRLLDAQEDRRLVAAVGDLPVAGVQALDHEPHADPGNHDEDHQQAAGDRHAPPGNQLNRTDPDHHTQPGHQHQQHATAPQRGGGLQPAKIVDRRPPGLRGRHLVGLDLLQILIKERGGAVPDDSHRVGEPVGGSTSSSVVSSSRRRTKWGTR